MSSQSVAGTPTCGSLGCTGDAWAVINHPKIGEIVACRDCATGHEVVRRV